MCLCEAKDPRRAFVLSRLLLPNQPKDELSDRKLARDSARQTSLEERCWSAESLDNVASCSYIIRVKVVGVRELKNRLSEYLRMVRAGEQVLVTDRGEVVAELKAPGRPSWAESLPPAVAALAKRGSLIPGAPNEPDIYPELEPVLSSVTAAELLDQERGES